MNPAGGPDGGYAGGAGAGRGTCRQRRAGAGTGTGTGLGTGANSGRAQESAVSEVCPPSAARPITQMGPKIVFAEEDLA